MSEFEKVFEEMYSDADENLDHYDMAKHIYITQQAKIDDLTELNRLKTIALEQSVNRTSIHVHEKIVALESKLKGNKDETGFD